MSTSALALEQDASSNTPPTISSPEAILNAENKKVTGEQDTHPSPGQPLSRTTTLNDAAAQPSNAGDGKQARDVPPAGGEGDKEQHEYPSKSRRWILLSLFSLAQFMDIFASSGVVIGIADIAADLDMNPGEANWVVNAYALTLAAFLLTGGRLSDMFSAKWTFTIGFAWLGAFSLGLGFVDKKNTFIALRSLQGIGAALTIPSALRMIVLFFPPEEREVAISVFGASGALANVLGVVIGGILLLASWDWIFFLIAIICLPLAVLSALVTPSTKAAQDDAGRKPKFDYLGTFGMIAAFVLIIYGMTNGDVTRWDTARTLAPMLIGFALIPLFFFWETRIDPYDALIDPKVWKIRNVILISIISLFPYYWWFLVEVSYAQIMQERWGNSAVLTGAKFLPIGIAGGLVAGTGGSIPAWFPLKWRFVVGCILSSGAALMYAFCADPDDYWRLFFPASIIGSGGTALVYVSGNIALMMSIPHEFAGVAGGIFNSCLQLGVTVFLSVSTAIQVSFPEVEGQPAPSSEGYKNAFFFLMACFLFVIAIVLLFFVDPLKVRADLEEARTTDEKEASSAAGAPPQGSSVVA